MDDNYTNIEECNLNKNRKIFIVFDNMFADMLSNKKTNPIVTELFIVGRNLDISLAFTKQAYFSAPKKHWIVHTISLWKFQNNGNFNKSYLIIRQILTLKNLWIFTKYVLQKHIFLVTDATFE